jgi:hypothetical protein
MRVRELAPEAHIQVASPKAPLAPSLDDMHRFAAFEKAVYCDSYAFGQLLQVKRRRLVHS